MSTNWDNIRKDLNEAETWLSDTPTETLSQKLLDQRAMQLSQSGRQENDVIEHQSYLVFHANQEKICNPRLSGDFHIRDSTNYTNSFDCCPLSRGD